MDTKEKKKAKTYAGLQPLWEAWSQICERDDRPVGDEKADVKKFLLKLGYLETSEEMLNILVPLVISSGHGEKICLRKFYASIVPPDASVNALSEKVKYHLARTYDIVRANICNAYGYDLGDFYGVKSLVHKLGMLYTVCGFDSEK